ncbi:MAG TPA: 16S rRNA (guanine(527)-N(7))-methyltransferase RsmG [Pyrinomonadaceae bacterium]|mgnify:CR=1 FL=1|nr:16S rRNA (guanine(527)-N(7))-methyltransferase RsmG [Pyrinomonadaceae bacterium]
MRNEFVEAVKANQPEFEVELSDPIIERLVDYYAIILEHNPILHLVGPCTPAEFAVRHILESLALLEHLPEAAQFADVGTGAGFPSIPCLIARPDISATLIESREKKARFLADAVEKLGLGGRVEIVNRQFQEIRGRRFKIVTCRALEKFGERIQLLIERFSPERMLLFGGPSLAEKLMQLDLQFEAKLLPLSRERFLYIVKNQTFSQLNRAGAEPRLSKQRRIRRKNHPRG